MRPFPAGRGDEESQGLLDSPLAAVDSAEESESAVPRHLRKSPGRRMAGGSGGGGETRSVYDRQVMEAYVAARHGRGRRPFPAFPTAVPSGASVPPTSAPPTSVPPTSAQPTMANIQLLFQPNLLRSSWKQRLLFRFDSNGTARKWELMDAAWNLLFCCLYIANTMEYSNNIAHGIPYTNRLLDFALAVILLCQFLPWILLSVNVVRTLLSPLSLLTFLSTVPVFLSFYYGRMQPESIVDTYMSAGPFVYAYPFRFVRFHMAIMACLVPSKTDLLKFSLITRKVVRLAGFLVFLFVTVAAFVHMVQNKVENIRISFFDSFFFAIVGRLDIVGDGFFSRLAILFVVLSSAIFVPVNLAELINLISRKSKFDHSYKKRVGQNHVIVCGLVDTIALRSFLKEFFCPDHGSSTVNTDVVILGHTEPSEELQDLLSDPLYSHRVQYIKGSTSDARKLRKVRPRDAKAAFLFSSKFASTKAAEEDASNVMHALALKKQHQNLQLHVQVLLPEHKSHFDYLADTTVCIEELKLGLISQNCRCVGFATLMYLLTTSVTSESVRKLLNNVRPGSRYDWAREYLQGCNQEIYPTTLSPAFAGLKFTEACSLLYRTFGAVMIGVGVPNEKFAEKQRKRTLFMRLRERTTIDPAEEEQFLERIQVKPTDYDLFLNPGEYTVRGGEIAFIITSQSAFAKLISEFSPADISFATETAQRQKGVLAFLKRNFQLGGSPTGKPFVGTSSAPSPSPVPTLGGDTAIDVVVSEGKSMPPKLAHGSPVKRLVEKPTTSGAVHDLLRNPTDADLRAATLKEKQRRLLLASRKTPVKRYSMSGTMFADDASTSSGASVGGETTGTGPSGRRASSTQPEESFVESEMDGMPAQEHQPGFVSRILQQAIGLGISDPTEQRQRSWTTGSMSSDLPDESMLGDQERQRHAWQYPSHLPSFVQGHILICDYSETFPYGIEYLIAPLRAPHLLQPATTTGKDTSAGWFPIVVLSPAPPNDHQRRALGRFDDVYVIHGSPLSRKDLRRAGVDRCTKAVVLTSAEKGRSDREHTADASSLLVVLNIESLALHNDVFITTEFIHSENMKFVGDVGDILMEEGVLDLVYGRTLMHPSFMAGHVFSQSMMDTLLSQNYYNPHILSILRHMLFSGIFHQQNLEATSHPANRNSMIPTMPQHGHLWLIRLPPVLVGVSYGDLFDLLALDYQAVPLGIYRIAEAAATATGGVEEEQRPRATNKSALRALLEEVEEGSSSDEEEDVRYCYVYCNPTPKTKLRSTDRVYVLSAQMPVFRSSVGPESKA